MVGTRSPPTPGKRGKKIKKNLPCGMEANSRGTDLRNLVFLRLGLVGAKALHWKRKGRKIPPSRAIGDPAISRVRGKRPEEVKKVYKKRKKKKSMK